MKSMVFSLPWFFYYGFLRDNWKLKVENGQLIITTIRGKSYPADPGEPVEEVLIRYNTLKEVSNGRNQS